MIPGRSEVEAESPSPPIALAIVNARVWTGDLRHPWADALFLRAGRIEAVGSSAEVRKRSGAVTKVIDAKGLLAQHPRRGGTLVRGGPADVMLIDRPLSTTGQSALHDTEIVLAIESGRIVTDRDALAR